MATTKKSTRKRSVTKAPVVQQSEEIVSSRPAILSKFSDKKNNKIMWGLAGVLALVILAALAYNNKEYFVVAMVNGKPITKIRLDRELEKAAGKETLENIITEELIYQEAQKKNITVTEADIDIKLAEIEKQVGDRGAKLDDLLAAQGQTRETLRGQLKLQTLVEKMAGQGVQVGDEEIKAYFDQNVSVYPKGTTLEGAKEEIRAQLVQQKMSQQVSAWITELRTNAKIENFLKL